MKKYIVTYFMFLLSLFNLYTIPLEASESALCIKNQNSNILKEAEKLSEESQSSTGLSKPGITTIRDAYLLAYKADKRKLSTAYFRDSEEDENAIWLIYVFFFDKKEYSNYEAFCKKKFPRTTQTEINEEEIDLAEIIADIKNTYGPEHYEKLRVNETDYAALLAYCIEYWENGSRNSQERKKYFQKMIYIINKAVENHRLDDKKPYFFPEEESVENKSCRDLVRDIFNGSYFSNLFEKNSLDIKMLKPFLDCMPQDYDLEERVHCDIITDTPWSLEKCNQIEFLINQYDTFTKVQYTKVKDAFCFQFLSSGQSMNFLPFFRTTKSYKQEYEWVEKFAKERNLTLDFLEATFPLTKEQRIASFKKMKVFFDACIKFDYNNLLADHMVKSGLVLFEKISLGESQNYQYYPYITSWEKQACLSMDLQSEDVLEDKIFTIINEYAAPQPSELFLLTDENKLYKNKKEAWLDQPYEGQWHSFTVGVFIGIMEHGGCSIV